MRPLPRRCCADTLCSLRACCPSTCATHRWLQEQWWCRCRASAAGSALAFARVVRRRVQNLHGRARALRGDERFSSRTGPLRATFARKRGTGGEGCLDRHCPPLPQQVQKRSLRPRPRRGATPPHRNDLEQVGGSNARSWVEKVPVDDAGDPEDGRAALLRFHGAVARTPPRVAMLMRSSSTSAGNLMTWRTGMVSHDADQTEFLKAGTATLLRSALARASRDTLAHGASDFIGTFELNDLRERVRRSARAHDDSRPHAAGRHAASPHRPTGGGRPFVIRDS